MYFSKDFLISLYSKMKKLYTGENIEAQGGTQYCSEIKYFLATDKFKKINNRNPDYSKNDDKKRFCDYVGDIVLLGKNHNSLFTKNFASNIGIFSDAQDFNVGSNFFSTNVCSTARQVPTQEFTWPSRDAILLKIKYPEIEIYADGYKNFYESYLSSSYEKCAILLLWLYRFENFNSVENILTELGEFIHSKYSSLFVDCIKINETACQNKLLEFLKDVSVSEICPEISKQDISSTFNAQLSTINYPYNRIIFGAPGTGKSFQLKKEQEEYFDESHFERVTFHPNYSYAQFVGVYKPKMKKENGTETISYSFVPGAFLRVLIKAIKSQQEGKNENYLLIIEEINRTNVAAVFGDTFQLLDRKNGESEYRIALTEDIKNYLDNLPAEEKINISDLYIPSNMYIWATMNSADQGVMPLDAAFKRRWNFEYLNIDANENGVKNIEIPNTKNADGNYNCVKWNLFRKALNSKLKNEPSLNVNEDKLLGSFFISLKDLQNAKTEPEKFIDLFKSKVLMYLFEDVCKMNPKALFTGIDTDGRIHYSDVCEQFDKKGIGIFVFDAEELGKTE